MDQYIHIVTPGNRIRKRKVRKLLSEQMENFIEYLAQFEYDEEQIKDQQLRNYTLVDLASHFSSYVELWSAPDSEE